MRSDGPGETTHYHTRTGKRAPIVFVIMAMIVLIWVGLSTDGFGLLDSSDEDTSVALDPTVVPSPEPSPSSTPELMPTLEVEPLPTLPVPPTPEASDPLPTPVMVPQVYEMAARASCEISQVTSSGDPVHYEWSPYWHYSSAEGEQADSPLLLAAGPSQSGPVWSADSGPQLITVTPVPDDLTLRVRNLDGTGSEMSVELTEDPLFERGVIALGEIDFLSDGCWELSIDGHVFVIYVLPDWEDPDIERARRARSSYLPYELPASCEVTDWRDPSINQLLPPGHSIDGQGLILWHHDGVLFEGENEISLYPEWIPNRQMSAQITAQRIDDPARTVEIDGDSRVTPWTRNWSIDVSFPTPGCWELTADVEDQSLEATVYVYESE